MTFGQFLSILRARWWVALLVFLVVVGTTVGVSLLLPKNYTGTASVVIDVKPDPVIGHDEPHHGHAQLHGHAGGHHDQRPRGAARDP